MNCGRSSSVEWKLPKLQRRVRFPSPAPAPPGHAPGGFVMPTSHPPSTECGGTIGATLSPRELGPAVPVQNSPCTPGTPPVPVQNSPSSRCTVPVPVQNSPHTSHTAPVPVQNSPSTPKISQFGAFCSCWESFIPFLLPTSRAWRVFSRTNTSTTTGTKETTPPTQHTKPRDEILSAPAPHTAPHNETFTAPARHKQPKFSHFHHAGANFLSQHTPHTHTGATFLSTNASAGKIDPNKTFIIFDSVITSRPDRKDIGDGAPITTRRSSALDTAPMHQIAQHCTGN